MSRPAAPGPRLYVISRPALDVDAIEEFLADEGLGWRRSPDARPAEEAVELAGRICYLSLGDRQSPRSNREYVQRLIGQGHHSVLEHAAWTFVLVGVTRAFTHQFVRHRVGFSYSQLSQQYHDERDNRALMPGLVRDHADLAELWEEAVTKARDTYARLVDALTDRAAGLTEAERRRLMRSAARTVLPAATETKIAFSANGRSLRNFLVARGDIPGDEEMRKVSVVLLRTMADEAPALFSDFGVVQDDDGLEVVRQLD